MKWVIIWFGVTASGTLHPVELADHNGHRMLFARQSDCERELEGRLHIYRVLGDARCVGFPRKVLDRD